ncbi:conjugative transfer region lipoprotein [Pseudomonas aeruginosa]|nr:conjugative transfer region lipoprotein [Pseudomonas aeruginosa]
MHSNLTNLARGLALALAVAVLGGCATSKEKLLTHGDRTMMDIWQQEAGDGGGGGAQPGGTPAASCSMRARACVGP